MTEYQTHGALVATLETEIVRLRAVNAELRSSIQAPIQPDTKLVEAARQALEALEKCSSALAEELAAWDIDPPLHHVLEASNACAPAITALREALEAKEPWTPDDMAYRPGGLSQSAAVNKEPIGLALIRREDGEVVAFYPMDMAPELAGLNERFELVMAYRGPQPGRRPLTDEQIDAIGEALPGGIQGFLKLWGWRQFARAVKRALRIEGGRGMNVGSMIMIANGLGITVSSEDADRIVGAIKNAYNTGWEDALSVAGRAQAVEPEHLLHDAHPPYTTPQPARQPLTDDEVHAFINGWASANGSYFDLCRAVERAHGIGGEE